MLRNLYRATGAGSARVRLASTDAEEDRMMCGTMGLCLLICLAHLSEHIAQAVQIYVYNIPLHQAGGVLGKFFPWLVHSETLHYGYALIMWVGLWHFRGHFIGAARLWWMVAFGIQAWHH